MVDIFIEGLEVYGHHGVAPEEKILGQRFYFDVRLTVEDCPAALTDRVEDAVDYTEVIDLVVEVATTESYSLLERLARVTAEAILKKFPVDEVWVQVVKPHPPVACALTGVSAAIELQRADIEG
jgi:dihydroneopterin aldolase